MWLKNIKLALLGLVMAGYSVSSSAQDLAAKWRDKPTFKNITISSSYSPTGFGTPLHKSVEGHSIENKVSTNAEAYEGKLDLKLNLASYNSLSDLKNSITKGTFGADYSIPIRRVGPGSDTLHIFGLGKYAFYGSKTNVNSEFINQQPLLGKVGLKYVMRGNYPSIIASLEKGMYGGTKGKVGINFNFNPKDLKKANAFQRNYGLDANIYALFNHNFESNIQTSGMGTNIKFSYNISPWIHKKFKGTRKFSRGDDSGWKVYASGSLATLFSPTPVNSEFKGAIVNEREIVGYGKVGVVYFLNHHN